MNEPDFENYSLDELLDSLNNIDRGKYPERVEKIELEIKKREEYQNIIKTSVTNSKPSNPFVHNYKKRKGFWASQRITDIKSAESAIKKGWIAGLSFGFYLLLLTVLAITGNTFIPNNGFTFTSFIDVFLVIGLSYGIFRKNRACAILLMAYVYLPHLIALFQSEKSNFSLLEIGLLYFLSLAVLGTINYYKFSSGEMEIKKVEYFDDLTLR